MINLIGGIVYLVAGTSELQHWAKDTKNDENEDNRTKLLEDPKTITQIKLG